MHICESSWWRLKDLKFLIATLKPAPQALRVHFPLGSLCVGAAESAGGTEEMVSSSGRQLGEGGHARQSTSPHPLQAAGPVGDVRISTANT